MLTLNPFQQLAVTSYDSSYTYSSSSSSEAAAGLLVIFGLLLPFLILLFAATWRVYTKAGQPGWAAIVPIYNMLVYLRVVGRPWWWLMIFIGLSIVGVIPLVGILASIGLLVLGIIISHDLSKSFGKGGGFTVLLVLLPFVGFPMLAWGNAKYLGPAALGAGAGSAPTPPSAGGGIVVGQSPQPPVAPTPPTTPQSPIQ